MFLYQHLSAGQNLIWEFLQKGLKNSHFQVINSVPAPISHWLYLIGTTIRVS